MKSLPANGSSCRCSWSNASPREISGTSPGRHQGSDGGEDERSEGGGGDRWSAAPTRSTCCAAPPEFFPSVVITLTCEYPPDKSRRNGASVPQMRASASRPLAPQSYVPASSNLSGSTTSFDFLPWYP